MILIYGETRQAGWEMRENELGEFEVDEDSKMGIVLNWMGMGHTLSSTKAASVKDTQEL